MDVSDIPGCDAPGVAGKEQVPGRDLRNNRPDSGHHLGVFGGFRNAGLCIGQFEEIAGNVLLKSVRDRFSEIRGRGFSGSPTRLNPFVRIRSRRFLFQNSYS